MSPAALIAPIVIDALAETLLRGPLWAAGLYLASLCAFLAEASYPAGRAWLEMQRLLPRQPIVEPSKPSNVVPFRPRRERVAAIDQPMEAAE